MKTFDNRASRPLWMEERAGEKEAERLELKSSGHCVRLFKFHVNM